MLAFIEHPDQLRKLQANPDLLPSAVEEVVRWSSPIIHFGRTATEDYELRGKPIKAGDALGLFYASANRDEEVFHDANALRLDRKPNPHLGFGIGEHFCLGAHLARKTSGAIFRELVTRLEEVELTGSPERTASNLVPGLKHLPIRYRLSAASA